MQIWLVACVMAGWLAVTQVSAQQQGIGGEAPSFMNPIVSIDFPGGTVKAYVDAIRKAAAPQPVNVILSQEAAEATIAPISLKTVALDTALLAIQPAAGAASGSWNITRINPRTQEAPVTAAAPAFSIELFPRARAAGPTAPVSVEVFSIAALIRPTTGKPTPVQTVLAAVQAAVDLQTDRGARANVKFHEESALVIVRGTDADHRAVRQVLEQLTDEQQQLAHRVDAKEQRIRSLELDMERIAIAIDLAAQEADVSRQQLEEASRMAQAGMMSQQELREAQLEVSRAEARKRELELQARRLKTEVEAVAPIPLVLDRNYSMDGLSNKTAAVYKLIEVMREVADGFHPRYHHDQGGALVLTATEAQHKVFAAAIAGMRATPAR